MGKTKKILSAILAMALLFSSMSIGVEAAYNAYKDEYIAEYDAIDKPVLTTDQYGSMIVDELDRMLAEEAILLDIDLGGILSINLDCTSVDAALDSVVSLWGQVENARATIGGDIVNIDFSAIANAPRRGTAGATDLDIVYALLEFFADNSAILGKVADGTLDLGILSGFVAIGDYLNVPKLLKKILAEVVYDDEDLFPADFDTETAGNQTYDQMTIDWYLEQMILYFINKSDVSIPASLLNLIDLNGISVYRLIEQFVKLGLNSLGVPVLNSSLKIKVRELCGVDYTGVTTPSSVNGDTSKLNKYANFIDINYVLPEYNFSTWATGDSWINHINDFLGWILTNIDNEEKGFTVEWNFADGNEGLLGNIANIAKQLLSATGDDFFASYIDVPTPAEYAVMTDEELVCFIIQATVNGSIDGIYLNDTQDDSILEILFYVAKHYAALYVPAYDYGEFDDYADDQVYATLDILADIIVYAMNQYTNANLSYQVGFDAVLDGLMDWVITNYAGFLNLSGDATDIWSLLDEILFTIIPNNWIAERDTDGDGIGDEVRDNIYDIVFTDFIENLSELDVMGFINLFSVNKNYTGNNASELDQSLTYVIINRVKDIINFIIPGVFADDYTDFEDLLTGDVNNSGITGEKFKNVITNLLDGLYNNAPRILGAALPIACAALDLSTEQEFAYPYISLPETITSATTSFYIYNESSGLNTAATYANGSFEQDDLYKYQILGVTTNQVGVSVAPQTGVINGGDDLTFNIIGTPAQNAVLMVSIRYNVLDEQGNAMTASPLVNNILTFVSDIEDDGDNDTLVDINTTNKHKINYKKTIYIDQDSNLGRINNADVSIAKDAPSDNNGINSVVTGRTVNIPSALSNIGLKESVAADTYARINISRNGGFGSDEPFDVDAALHEYKVTEYNPETFEPVEVTKYRRPADGTYNISVTYTMSASSNGGPTETIPLTITAYFYDDFDLDALLSAAVSANRQQSNYGTGTFTVQKQVYDELMGDYYYEEVTLNGAECWSAYVTAMKNAASVVYRPRIAGTFASTHISNYETYAAALKDAIDNLKYFELSTGVLPVENALYAVDPLNTQYLEDMGTATTTDDVYRDAYYYEAGHTFFGRIDYEGYSYERFKSVANDARGMIAAANNEENPQVFNTLEINYTASRVNLYASRLKRVPGKADRLDEAIAAYSSIYNAGNTGYSAESWEAFVTAYEFAQNVSDEAITNPGTTYSTGYLNGDGVRQTKINESFEGLNESRKKLEEAVIAADLTALNAELDNNSRAIFTAGNAAGTYTEISWASFTTAYNAAIAALTAGYNADQQATVDSICSTLVAARTNLETAATTPEIVFVENEDYGNVLQYTQGLTDEFESTTYTYVFGACSYDAWIVDSGMVDGMIYDAEATGEGYEIVLAAMGGDDMSYGTGATIEVRNNGVVVDSYPLVVFGDLDGDGTIGGTDFTMLKNIANGTVIYSWMETGWFMDSPQFYACDVNDDWSTDSNDAVIVKNFVNGVIPDFAQERAFF